MASYLFQHLRKITTKVDPTALYNINVNVPAPQALHTFNKAVMADISRYDRSFTLSATPASTAAFIEEILDVLNESVALERYVTAAAVDLEHNVCHSNTITVFSAANAISAIAVFKAEVIKGGATLTANIIKAVFPGSALPTAGFDLITAAVLRATAKFKAAILEAGSTVETDVLEAVGLPASMAEAGASAPSPSTDIAPVPADSTTVLQGELRSEQSKIKVMKSRRGSHKGAAVPK